MSASSIDYAAGGASGCTRSSPSALLEILERELLDMIKRLKLIMGVLQPILPWQPKAVFYSIHFSSQEK